MPQEEHQKTKKDFDTIEVERYENIVKILDKIHNNLISSDFPSEKRKDYTERYTLLRKEYGQLKHLYDMFKYKIKDIERKELERKMKEIVELFNRCQIINQGKVIKMPHELYDMVIDLYSHINWKVQLVR